MVKRLFQHITTIITFLAIATLVASASTEYINPTYLHVLAFAGFLFPFLWLFNLVMVVFNLLQRNWKLLIVGSIVAIFTFGQISSIFQISGKTIKPTDKEKVVKLMSFNTRMFDFYQWTGSKKTNEDVFDFIRKENPDIVCFQEFFSYDNRSQFAEHHVLARLNQFPYHHIEYRLINKSGKRFGQATFSKYPIVARKQLTFPNTSNFSIQTDIKIKDQTIRVFNNHLESVRLKTQHYNFIDSINLKSEKEAKAGIVEIFYKLHKSLKQRATQSETISQHIKNSPYPVFVCGDFNDTPISYVYKTMRSGLKDTFIEAGSGLQGTYNGKLPSFRIDFIFHDPKFETYKFNTFKKNFSDHYPIMASIKL